MGDSDRYRIRLSKDDDDEDVSASWLESTIWI